MLRFTRLVELKIKYVHAVETADARSERFILAPLKSPESVKNGGLFMGRRAVIGNCLNYR